jgi:hypothetical protein
MQFTRVTNQILLGAVAFGVSGCVSLVVNRDIKQAFFTGLITVPATYSATALIHTRRINQGKKRLNSLEDEIQELEDYKTELNQYVFDALAEEQEVEASINALQSELTNLRTKVLEGYNQRKEQNWELYLLQNQKQQQENEVYLLQNQTISLEDQIKELTQELNQIELSKKTDILKLESEIDSRKIELKEIEFQLIEKQNYQKLLDQELLNYSKQKYQVIEEKRTLEANLNSLRGELEQLQAQILEQQKEKKALQQGLFYFEEQRRQLLEGLHNLKVQSSPSLPPLPGRPTTKVTELPDEWAEFREQLPDAEFLVLKAIAEQDNPSAAIKKIAEDNLTMPEVLIDSINERTMNTIGDLIIEEGLSSTPQIVSEYLIVVKTLIKA